MKKQTPESEHDAQDQALAQQNRALYEFNQLPEFTIEQCKEEFAKFLMLKDEYVLEVVIGSILAHHFLDDPCWVLLVAPPSGGKSEILNSLLDLPFSYPLSTLTTKTFASGFMGGKMALLNKLKNEILIFKDFTSLLSLPIQEQGEIMSQLREIYDGKFDKEHGTGVKIGWEGKLGFVAGVTEIIDMRRGALNILGERFIQYRIDQPNRKDVVVFALKNRAKTKIKERRDALRKIMAGTIKYYLPLVKKHEAADEDATIEMVAHYSDFATKCRTDVIRDSHSPTRDIQFVPHPEMPTRFAQELMVMIKGFEVMGLPLARRQEIIKKICFDSIPKLRRELLDWCAAPANLEEDGRISNTKLSSLSGYAKVTAERTMEELAVLKVVSKTKKTSQDNSAIMWHLNNEWRDLFALPVVSEQLDLLTIAVEATSDTDQSEGGSDVEGEDAPPPNHEPPPF